jgi:hypothetical protein
MPELTEEQRQKLLQLQNRNTNLGFDTGLNTDFEEVDPFASTVEPNLPQIVDDSPLKESVLAKTPGEALDETGDPIGFTQQPTPLAPQIGTTDEDSLTAQEPHPDLFTPTLEEEEPAVDLFQPPTVTPGVTPGVTIPKTGIGFEDLQRQLGGAFKTEEEAVTRFGQLQEEEYEEKQKFVEQKSKLLEDHNVKIKGILDSAAAETSTAIKQIDQQVKDLGEREYAGFWQSKSTGERILAALSVALGAYAQGISGGKVPNTALSILNKAMDDDFKQFQASSNKKIQLINQSRASLAAKQHATNLELNKQNAYKLGQLEQLEGKINEISNKFKSPKTKEQSNVLLGQIQQRRISTQSQLQSQIETRNAKKAELDIKKQQNLLNKQSQKFRKRIVPGVGEALTEDDAKELKKASVVKRDFDAKLQELIELREINGPELLDREAVARGKQLSKEILLKYKDLSKLGVLSVTDMEILETIIPADPLQFDPSMVLGQDPTMTQLKKLQTDVDSQYRYELETRLVPGSAPAQEPKKQVRPAPQGKRVEQDDKTYEWDGYKYVEIR